MNSYYLSEINKIPLLTLEEEKSLATKAFSGDKSAQKKLVEHNLRFVVKIAKQYKGLMDVEDLINEGNMGLMHAAEKYDPSTGNKFSTYAIWWIKAYIQKAIRETSTGIRFPANKFDEMKKVKWNIVSLDQSIGNDDEEATLASFIKDDHIENPEDEYWKQELISLLNQFVKMLNPKEQTIIIKHYGLDGKDPMSLSEIGTFMDGYSKERIRQLEKRALNELKKNLINSNAYAGLAA